MNWFRRRCVRHTWAPWIIDPATKIAVRRCLFCKATKRELMA